MLRIGTACGSGLGSSFMVQMNIEKLLQQKGIDKSKVKVDHYDLGGASPDGADVWIVGKDLERSAQHLKNLKVLKSIIDMKELEVLVDQIIEENNL